MGFYHEHPEADERDGGGGLGLIRQWRLRRRSEGYGRGDCK